MAKLKAAARDALPDSDFGDPKDRKYPMPDKNHAADAKARVANKSPALKAKVDAKADRVLGKGVGPIPQKTLGSMVDSLKGMRR